MPLRADQVLMLGVAALGGFALYKLLIAPKDQTPKGDVPQPLPQRPQTPNMGLPNIPGPASLPAGYAVIPVQQLMPNAVPTIHLTNSRAYQGRIETIDEQGRTQGMPFHPDASAEAIATGLTALGFDAVQVFMSPEAAAGVFPREALANPGRGTRWFYGRYTAPTMDTASPEGLKLLWIVQGLGRPDSPENIPMRAAGYAYLSSTWEPSAGSQTLRRTWEPSAGSQTLRQRHFAG